MFLGYLGGNGQWAMGNGHASITCALKEFSREGIGEIFFQGNPGAQIGCPNNALGINYLVWTTWETLWQPAGTRRVSRV